jgi:hypothetical protein
VSAVEPLVDVGAVVGVVAQAGVDTVDRQLEVGGRALYRVVALAERVDDVGDVESGAEQRRPAVSSRR